MFVSIFHEIQVMVALNIIVKVVGYFLRVEMEKWMNEKVVKIVHRMREFVVEMVYWIIGRHVERVLRMLVNVVGVETER
jgi:hypothetical protein